MISGIKAAFLGLKLRFADEMAYRANFFISLVVMFAFEFFYPVVSALIYASGSSFPGWNLYEVLLIQGAFILAKGIAFPLFIGMYFSVMCMVRMGTLDIVLLRPRPAMFTLIIYSYNVQDSGKVFCGLAILIFAVAHLPAAGALQWALFILLILMSVGLIFAFVLLMEVFTIHFVGSNGMLAMIDPVTQFGLYPKSIYSKVLQVIITNIFPVAMIGFFPSSVLLGKNTEGFLPAFITTVCFIALSVLLWNRAVSKYTSAGG